MILSNPLPMRIFPAWRPVAFREEPMAHPSIGQAPIATFQHKVETGLEKYATPIGFLAGGGVLLLASPQFPGAIGTVAAVAGLGLAGYGAYQLVSKVGEGEKAIPSEEAAPYIPPSLPTFNNLAFEVMSPKSGENIGDVRGVFRERTIPVEVSSYNPSNEDATFTLEFNWREDARYYPFGIRKEYSTSKRFQVTAPAGRSKTYKFDLPSATTEVTLWDADVWLEVKKIRIGTEPEQIVGVVNFSYEG